MPSPLPAPVPPTSRTRWLGAGVAIGLIVLVFAVFWPAAAGEFLSWDDDINLTTNPHLRPLSGENLQWMFTDVALMRRYVPLAWLGWGIEQAAFGLNARASHQGNIVFHAANAALVFALFGLILARRAPTTTASSSRTLVVAAGVALLWAVHPLRVESVAWASGRMYLQATFFLLLATLAYLQSQSMATGRRGLWLTAAVVAYAASLFTYPLALGFPAVLLLIDLLVTKQLTWPMRLPSGSDQRRVWMEKLPFVAMALLALASTLWARANAAGIWAGTNEGALDAAAIAHRIMRGLYHWLHVLWKPFVPFGLSPVYTDLVDPNPLAAQYLVSAGVFMALSAWLVIRARRDPAPLAIWICHLIFLLPYVGLTEAAHYPNDRYTYLHGIIMTAVIATLLVRWPARITLAAAVAAAIALTALTRRQTTIWRTDESLFRHALASVGNDPYRGDLTWRLANTLMRGERKDEARRLYEETLRIAQGAKPRAAAHQGLGVLILEAGAADQAAEHFRQAVELSPGTAQHYQWYSFALLHGGHIQEALPVITRGLQLDPTNLHLLQYRQGARQLLGLPPDGQR